MNGAKALVSLAGTAVIAGWVAFSISAPRNVDNALNAPMASLDGSSIAEQMEQSRLDVRQDQCARYKDLANEAWERSMDNGTTDRDTAKIDRLDDQVKRFCD